MAMITRKLKQCKTCKTMQYLFSHGDCQSCWAKRKSLDINLKSLQPRKPISKYKTSEIKKVSTRQQKLLIAYKVIRDEFMKRNPTCQARLESCTYVSTECHHSKGRGEYLLDDSTFKSLCHNCHSFLETHPEVSRALGFTLNRLDKY